MLAALDCPRNLRRVNEAEQRGAGGKGKGKGKDGEDGGSKGMGKGMGKGGGGARRGGSKYAGEPRPPFPAVTCSCPTGC